MLRQSENLENKEKVKYDLYKILRMSILLNPNEVDKITLEKFKEASLKIDKMAGELYEQKLDELFYETTTLEEEEKRLKNLVSFIKERKEKRKSLLEDYKSVTNKELENLEYISRSGDLDLYEKRLKTIKEYLDNSKLIEVNEQELEELKEKLVKEYDRKSSNEIKNAKLEETLYNTFVNTLYEMDLYSSIEINDIDKQIADIQDEIKETKDQKDTFEAAFNNLKLSGISGDLELEYASYVENSKRNYFYVKEKEIILKLFKVIQVKENEYADLYYKREKVKELLQERILLRAKLGIKDKDLMIKVSDILEEQQNDIETEKETIDAIKIFTERINLKENRLEELNRSVKRPEVLAILKEYNMIDTYDHTDIFEDDIQEENEIEETQEENAQELLKELLEDNEFNFEEEIDNEEEFNQEEVEMPKEYLPNQIKESSVIPSMNFGLSRLKSISVMKRVGDMLGINAKKLEEKKKEEELFIVPENPIIDMQKETQIFEEPKEEKQEATEELFWTPNEFFEIKEDEKNAKEEELFLNESNPQLVDNQIFENNNPKETPIFEINKPDENSIFELKVPEIKEEKDGQIFEEPKLNQELIFPEPVMPELKVLPENKEEKFVWPESAENFDINGIFPS